MLRNADRISGTVIECVGTVIGSRRNQRSNVIGTLIGSRRNMQAATGRTINCDVYGKKDDIGIWYIKFAVVDSTLLFSCHLAENDMELKNGKILRTHHDE